MTTMNSPVDDPNDMVTFLHLLGDPIVDLCLVIQDNINRAAQYEEESPYANTLQIFDLVTLDFVKNSEHPQTVCLSPNCPAINEKKPSQNGGSGPPNQRRPLHPNVCRKSGLVQNSSNPESNCDCYFRQNQQQQVPSDDDNFCEYCGCDESNHSFLNLEPFVIEQQINFEYVDDLTLQLERELNDILRMPKTIENYLKENPTIFYDNHHDVLLMHMERRRGQIGPQSGWSMLDTIGHRYDQSVGYKKQIFSIQNLVHTMERRCVHYQLTGSSVKSMMTQAHKLLQDQKIVQQSMPVHHSNYLARPPAVNGVNEERQVFKNEMPSLSNGQSGSKKVEKIIQPKTRTSRKGAGQSTPVRPPQEPPPPAPQSAKLQMQTRETAQVAAPHAVKLLIGEKEMTEAPHNRKMQMVNADKVVAPPSIKPQVKEAEKMEAPHSVKPQMADSAKNMEAPAPHSVKPQIDQKEKVAAHSVKPQIGHKEKVKAAPQINDAEKFKAELASDWSFPPPRASRRKPASFRPPPNPRTEEEWVKCEIYYPPEPRRRRQQCCMV